MTWQPIDTAPKDARRIILAKHGWTKDMGDLKQGSAEWKALFFNENAPRKYHCWWVSRGYWDADRQKWTDGIDALNEPTHWVPDFALPPVCQVPPEGWCCTRAVGHEGPCAAYPTRIEGKDT